MSTASLDASTFYAAESTPCAVDQISQDAVEDTHDDELARIRSLVSRAMDLCSVSRECGHMLFWIQRVLIHGKLYAESN